MISLTDPGVLRTVVGSSLYLTVVVIIGLALGALLRKTAAGLSVFAAVFFVIPIVVGALPQNITGFAPYLPSNAGGALWGSPLNAAHPLSPWTGFAVLCGYAVVLTARPPGGCAAATPDYPERRRGYEHVPLAPVENPGTRPPRSRVLDVACTLLAVPASFGSFHWPRRRTPRSPADPQPGRRGTHSGGARAPLRDANQPQAPHPVPSSQPVADQAGK